MAHRTHPLLYTIPLYTILLSLLLTPATTKTAENVVVPSCPPSAASCEFHLKVDYNMTMMNWIMAPDTGEPDVMLPVVVEADGTFFYKRRDCAGQHPLTEHDLETFLSGDGTYKKILAINGRFPGTPIVVYKGQMVSVFVTNEMENEVITIHWHGQKQVGTPWMDGGGGVSQCPITPRQTFQYKFKADPVGTHWYHGHIGHQRTLGMVAHFTVLDRSLQEENKHRGDDPIPTIDGEFHFMFNEGTEKPTDEYSHSLKAGYGFSGGFETETCNQQLLMADGSFANWVPFQSILINGKGHQYDKTTGQSQIPTLPLEVFTVRQGGRFRFRSVNAGLQMPFIVSIDEHKLNVISSDGSPVRTITTDNLIVAAGESFDFWLQADDPTSAGNYWIRVTTLQHKAPHESPDQGLAILHYDHVPQGHPTTTARNCTMHGCVNLNSPYKYHHPSTNIKCVPLMALRMPVPEPTLKPTDGTGFTELMLALDTGLKSTINGREHQTHAVPPQIYPARRRDVLCDEETCSGDGICRCTHELHVPLGHVVQITFYSHKIAAAPAGSSHPMHLHGHSFQVLKTGWPMYNVSTMVSNTPDITCGDTTGVCKHPRWVDPTWAGGNVPGLLTEGAITKDTVNVPAGGYVVIRFKADNPGFWLLHCHMDLHSEMGMKLVLKVGDVANMPPVPRGFPVCGDFDWDNAEFHERISNPQPQRKVKAQADAGLCSVSVPTSQRHYQIATAILGTAVFVAVLAMLLVAFKTCRRRKYYHKGLMVEVPARFLPSEETTPLLS